MSILAAFVIAVQAQAPEPILWLTPHGKITLQGREIEPIFSPGTRMIRTSQVTVFDFDGRRSGILIGDEKALAITDSFTVSTWVYLRSYVNDGPGAQILFRGDDRGGLDPYTLVVHRNGTVAFGVQNAEDRGFSVGAEIPLHKWTHLMGSWDMETGRLRLWLNGENVAFATTTVHPFAVLDKGWAPGIGIGNVQNGKGIHNQPINGQISDLRLMRGVWSPDDLLIRKPGIPPSN